MTALSVSTAAGRTTRLLLVLVGAVVTLVVAAAPASAHNSLVSTEPISGQELGRPPATVVLTFDEPAVAMGTQVLVTGPAGTVQQGPARLVDNTVSQSILGDAPAGRYTVDWRVTSADGHPVSGTFTFTTKEAGTGSSRPVPPPASSPASSTRSVTLVWSLVALVAIVGVVLGVASRRRRRAR